MTHGEQNARAYCESIDLNPDEMITRWDRNKWGSLDRTALPRWQCYVGAVVEKPAQPRAPRRPVLQLVSNS